MCLAPPIVFPSFPLLGFCSRRGSRDLRISFYAVKNMETRERAEGGRVHALHARGPDVILSTMFPEHWGFT